MDDDLAPTWRHVIGAAYCPPYLQTVEVQYIPRKVYMIYLILWFLTWSFHPRSST